MGGTRDDLVPYEQVRRLSLLLPNLVAFRVVPMTHFEFLADQGVHQDVIANAVKYKTCLYCFF
jgi:hypothetical protein